MKLIPDGASEKTKDSVPMYLDPKLVSQPVAALQLIYKEFDRVLGLVSLSLIHI